MLAMNYRGYPVVYLRIGFAFIRRIRARYSGGNDVWPRYLGQSLIGDTPASCIKGA
jgi:hypothetical protein